MWNAAAQPLVDAGKLTVIGVIQEQHAERCRLYAQWREFKFPIAQDPMTKLDLAVVPIALFIDEHGVVQNTRPRATALEDFVNQEFEAPASKDQPEPATEKRNAKPGAKQLPTQPKSANELVSEADNAILWRNSGRDPLDLAIDNYESALAKSPEDGKIMFRLGVAYRQRFDSMGGKEDDFDSAVAFWTAAIKANPNQYIWRRRIQQYGPRQIKPYPFYDWVDTAIADIKKRGDEPIKLRVPLSGAEIAKPQRKFVDSTEAVENPDPNNAIEVDSELIKIRKTVVPASIKPGQSVRVHLLLNTAGAKWNNESEPLRIWIDESVAGKSSQRLLEFPNPSTAESAGQRSLEFEFSTNADAKDVKITGFALYNICLANGQCIFRRQNFSIEIPFGEKSQ